MGRCVELRKWQLLIILCNKQFFFQNEKIKRQCEQKTLFGLNIAKESKKKGKEMYKLKKMQPQVFVSFSPD